MEGGTEVNTADETKIAWPAASWSDGGMGFYSDPDHWGQCNVLGVISGGYENMKLIDSTGNVFLVKEITTVPKITFFDRFFSFIINRRLKAKLLRYEFKSKISLEDFKMWICNTIDTEEEETQMWSEIDEPEELKKEILNCSTFEEVMRLPFLLGWKYIKSHAEDILELLKTKHVVLEGGSSGYRSQIIARIRSAMAARYSVYEIPAGIDSRESYLDAVRNCFPIESPSGMDIRKMNDNQVNDVQVDWMEFRKDDSFIIWNEIRDFHNLPELYGIFDRYVSQKSLFEEEKYPRSFRLLVNSNIPLDDYIRHAQFLYPSRENESNAEKLKNHIAFFHV